MLRASDSGAQGPAVLRKIARQERKRVARKQLREAEKATARKPRRTRKKAPATRKPVTLKLAEGGTATIAASPETESPAVKRPWLQRYVLDRVLNREALRR
jgi:hypothetical protein